MTILVAILVIAVLLLLAFSRASMWSWLLAVIVIVPAVAILLRIPADTFQIVGIVLAVVVAVLGISPLRRWLLSYPALLMFRRILPQVSATEQEALDAGTVWWEGDLFSGNPDWYRLIHFPAPALTEEEESFLHNEVEQLCAMLDDWDITHNRQDLPPAVWQFIKDQGFFGMIIPKEYGGLGFSAQAHSAVIAKIASRSATATVTVMVPNSLGPGELLMHYGTQKQKDTYLPRLAKGLEVPCFALTGPFAGSDAGSIPDSGVVCFSEFKGQQDVLGIRLTWEKRYITLGPVATLLGLAFRLYDPDRLVGGETDLGITLALIPTDTPGVNIGRRHFPLNSAFQNGPTWGTEVFIPMDYVIGGVARIGHGWRMLMECLAAGRSISLPASAAGGAKLAARASGAYGRVRKQFKMPIGKFEGVEEALARIAGRTYAIDAVRRLTAAGVDLGEKPAVVSAIAKYHCTELGRMVINDAMDVHGGKGICMGPSNYLARAYQQVPIGITVEGANILTRSMIIFGQGAIRAHPFVLREINAAHGKELKGALRDFDAALCGHVGFVLSNAVRSLLFGLFDGRGISVPPVENDRYYQRLTRYSAAFALAADAAMLMLGGSLKRREMISARLGDVLSQLYLGSALLKRFEDEGRPQEDLPLLRWAMQDALYKIETALDGVLQNFPSRVAAFVLRRLIFPLGRRVRVPSDKLGHEAASLLLKPGATRDRLTAGMYLPAEKDDPIGALEAALHSALECEPLYAKMETARKARKIGGKALQEAQRVAEAREKGILSAEEAELLERDLALQRKVIMVDDFAPAQLVRAAAEASPGTP